MQHLCVMLVQRDKNAPQSREPAFTIREICSSSTRFAISSPSPRCTKPIISMSQPSGICKFSEYHWLIQRTNMTYDCRFAYNSSTICARLWKQPRVVYRDSLSPTDSLPTSRDL